MPVRYFKRFRMEAPLPGPPVPPLPLGYAWRAWHDGLLEAHARVKYGSFLDETDALVFPSLGDQAGCYHLMLAIRQRPNFVPGATWLIEGPFGPVGTVQGLWDRGGFGAIQNVGVLPAHRGRGLGEALLLQALAGFARAGLHRAYLEVTADNAGALRLYRRAGFRCRKTIYKPVERPDVSVVPADAWAHAEAASL